MGSHRPVMVGTLWDGCGRNEGHGCRLDGWGPGKGERLGLCHEPLVLVWFSSWARFTFHNTNEENTRKDVPSLWVLPDSTRHHL